MTSFSLGCDLWTRGWMGSVYNLHERLQAPSSLTLTLSQLIMSLEIRASLVRSSSRAALKPSAIRETCRTPLLNELQQIKWKYLISYLFLFLGAWLHWPPGWCMRVCICAWVIVWSYYVGNTVSSKLFWFPNPTPVSRPLSGFTDVSVSFAVPSAFGIAKVRQVWLKDQGNKA